MKPYQLLPLIVTIVFGFFLSTVSAQDNTQLRHALVDGHEYEGYYVSGGEGTLLLLLVHDWDGFSVPLPYCLEIVPIN